MDCWMFIGLQNCLNVSDVNVVPASEMIFLGVHIQQISLMPFYQVICCKTAHLLHNRELAIVVYNAQMYIISNHENVSTDHCQWSVWYFKR